MRESCSTWRSKISSWPFDGLRSGSHLVCSAKGERPMSRFLRFSTLLGVAALLAALALVQVPDAQAQKKVLNIAAKEPETLDPHASILGQSRRIESIIPSAEACLSNGIARYVERSFRELNRQTVS